MKNLLIFLFIALNLRPITCYAFPLTKAAPNTVLQNYQSELSQSLIINDFSTNTATFFINNTTGLVWDVDLNLSLYHEQPKDLKIYLTSAQGTRILLSSHNGSTNQSNIFNPLSFDDQYLIPITDYVKVDLPQATALAPEDALDKFWGENPEGTWQLTVVDEQTTKTGVLSNATLSITTLLGQNLTRHFSVATSNLTNGTIANLEKKSFSLGVTNTGHYLARVKVQTWLKHTSGSDIDMHLISPRGTFVTLTTDNGQNNEDVFYGTVWDDRASNLATEVAYVNLIPNPNLVPEGKLAAFRGENPNGNWTLQIVDDAQSDEGTLEKWSLMFETLPGSITDVTGDDFTDIVTYKKNSVYVVPLRNGTRVGGALLAGFFTKGFKPVAINEFTGDQQADLLLQKDIFLTVQPFFNSYLSKKTIDLGEVIQPGFKVVATTDLNQDGLIDIISQNKTELGITLAIKKNNNVSYQFRALALGQSGNIIGADHTNLFQVVDTTLHLIPVSYNGSNFFTLGNSFLLSPAFRKSFKLIGIAEIFPYSLGPEIIIQRGSTISFSSTNLSRTAQTIYSGRRRGNLGTIIGPK